MLKVREEIKEYFLGVVENEIVDKNSQGYLAGCVDMVKSKLYCDVIDEDIELCKKYFKKEVLDFGTGSGFLALLLANEGYDVQAVDIDYFVDIYNAKGSKCTDNMVTDQKKIWNKFEKKYSNLKFNHYKKRLPFENNSFDGVLAYAVLEHVVDSEIDNVMLELRRVIKPGGYLYISRLPRKFSYIEAVARLLKLGFHEKLYEDWEIVRFLKKYHFTTIYRSLTDFVPAYPLFLNKFHWFLNKLDKFMLSTPFRYFAHDIRLVCRKI